MRIIPDSSRKARDEAMARVDEAADHEWKYWANRAVHNLARSQGEFSTDAVWALLDHWEVPAPREPRAIGPVMTRAVNDGLITPMGYKQSTSIKRHARPMRTYRGLL